MLEEIKVTVPQNYVKLIVFFFQSTPLKAPNFGLLLILNISLENAKKRSSKITKMNTSSALKLTQKAT